MRFEVSGLGQADEAPPLIYSKFARFEESLARWLRGTTGAISAYPSLSLTSWQPPMHRRRLSLFGLAQVIWLRHLMISTSAGPQADERPDIFDHAGSKVPRQIAPSPDNGDFGLSSRMAKTFSHAYPIWASKARRQIRPTVFG